MQLIDPSARPPIVPNRRLLIESFGCLAAHLVKRYRHWSLDEADMFQTAMVAVINAIDRYDPSIGVPLGAYVTLSIKWELGSQIKKIVREDLRAGRLPDDVRETDAELGDDSDYEDLRTAIGNLPSRERAILTSCFGLDGRTAERPIDVGKRYQCTGETIGDTNTRSLRTLRRALSA
jgi:RNA polymerase sigma factor (sigma-70 family)